MKAFYSLNTAEVLQICKNGPKGSQRQSWNDLEVAPRWPKGGPRMAPGWYQDGSRMAPGWPHDGTRMAPGWPRMALGWLKHGPRMALGNQYRLIMNIYMKEQYHDFSNIILVKTKLLTSSQKGEHSDKKREKKQDHYLAVKYRIAHTAQKGNKR